MPDLRVTEELGQPLQAPCILSFTIPVSLEEPSPEEDRAEGRVNSVADGAAGEARTIVLLRPSPEGKKNLRVVSAVLDVPAVVLHRGADPRLQQLLDHRHDLRVVLDGEQARQSGKGKAQITTARWRGMPGKGTSWIAVSMDAAALESRKSGCPDE